jgi:tetratricopeptide (TPR) repeat protein
MNNPARVLEHLIYISLPESMHKDIGGFQLDPTIMLPVETGGAGDDLDLGALSWEMIISGMLKILAWDQSNENVDYYRAFVLAVKPDIVAELTKSGIVKADNREWDIAEELFLALTGLQPGEPRATLNLALMYDQRAEGYRELGNDEIQKEFADKAFSAYIKALGQKPELPETHWYAGHFFLRQQSWGRAKKEFSRFMEISRDDEKKREVADILNQLKGSSQRDALFNEAFDFIRLGKETEGLEKIEEFIAIQDNVWNAWFLKGWALRRLGRYLEAYEAFSAARARGGESGDLFKRARDLRHGTGTL